MLECYLLIGTNLGDKTSNLKEATRLISEQVGEILTESSIYLTAAWGKSEQNDFLNQVLKVDTSLTPDQIMEKCLAIENEMGRERIEKWGSRLIDIDILYCEGLILKTKHLTVPHPEIQNRRFTLVPLVEVSPEYVHPVIAQTNSELLKECPDTLQVTKFE